MQGGELRLPTIYSQLHRPRLQFFLVNKNGMQISSGKTGAVMQKICLLFLMVIFLAGIPAFGQVDLSGEWFPLAHEDREVDRRGGAAIGDYTGLPINDAARMRADTYDASVFALPEWQCRPHGVDFITLGLSEMRIWKETDPETQQFTAWRMHWLRSAADRDIYMDGRPHPP